MRRPHACRTCAPRSERSRSVSEEQAQPVVCPTCGRTSPAFARYCFNCGSRLGEVRDQPADAFDYALDAALPRSAPAEADTWTASVEAWHGAGRPDPQPSIQTSASIDPPALTSPARPALTAAPPVSPLVPQPVPKKSNRTLWIILGIVGLILL